MSSQCFTVRYRDRDGKIITFNQWADWFLEKRSTPPYRAQKTHEHGPKLHESPHDVNANFDCPFAIENGCCHDGAVLGERSR
jgi:hypothetical protein